MTNIYNQLYYRAICEKCRSKNMRLEKIQSDEKREITVIVCLDCDNIVHGETEFYELN